MFNRGMLLAVFSTLILCLAGCGGDEEKKAESAPAAAAPAPAPKPEEKVEIYELTKDDIMSHSGWTSKNISVLGVKLGDRTREVEKNLGNVENTRTLTEDYLTVYQGNGVFVYTYKNTGRARRIEVNQAFGKKVADAKLQKLLNSGDLKYMREIFGMEEGDPVQNADDNATEYPYDSRGFRFVKFKVGGKTLNAIRFQEIKKTT
ncbi:MAG TPA: hypothetical protein VLL56_10085 [Terriglobia bacterium]|nr:hypothetical protein [Terriglobia bacterium]